MHLNDWVTLLASTISAVLLVRTGWVAIHLSRAAGGRVYAKGHIFLGLTLLLLFVTLTVASALVIRGGSAEHLLVSVLVLSCSLFVSILVRDHGQLERLVARRTAELTTANGRLESLLDNLPLGVVFAEAPSGEPLLVNRQAQEMLGSVVERPALAFPGATALFRRPGGEPYPAQELPLAQTLRTGEPHSTDALLVQRGESEPVRLWMTATTVRDEEGIPTSAICVVQDITERQRLQEMRDSLTHIIVHDLRNPLHAIAGYLELIAESGFIAATGDAQEYFRHVRTNCQNLVNMTTALLDLSRMEAGEMQLTIKEWRLRDIWSEVEAEIVSLARLKRLALCFDVPPQLAAVRADRSMLRRVMVNLLTNAICFAPIGSALTVSARVEDGFQRVSVADQGPGVAPEYHELIFRKSGRVESGQRGTYFSTGLGLAFCKTAVEMQGGTIGLESEVGKGSTFWFTVPVAEAEAASQRALGTVGSGAGAQRPLPPG